MFFLIDALLDVLYVVALYVYTYGHIHTQIHICMYICFEASKHFEIIAKNFFHFVFFFQYKLYNKINNKMLRYLNYNKNMI